MIVFFHEADDEHAPFPHRVMITPVRTTTVRNGVIRKTIKLGGETYVICAECDHWILRDIPDCPCEQRCHALGNLLTSLSVGT